MSNRNILLLCGCVACWTVFCQDARVESLNQALRLAEDKPAEALALLVEFTAQPDWETDAVMVAQVSARALFAQGKPDRALRWCKWGLQKGKYLGHDTTALAALQQRIRKALAEQERRRKIEEVGEDALLYKEARNLECRHAYGSAEVKYEDLVKRFPQSKYIHQCGLGIGRCLFWQWKCDACRAHITQFLAGEAPGLLKAEAQIVLGDLQLMAHFDGVEAIRSYEKARQLLVNEGETARRQTWRLEQRLGLAYFVMGNRNSAAECYKRARANMPPAGNQSDIERDLFTVQIIEDYIEKGRSPTPRWVLAGGGKNARVALCLGDLWYWTLDFDRARATYELVLSREGLFNQTSKHQQAYAKMQIALTYETKFQTAKAERLYRDVISRFRDFPGLPTVKLRLACMLFNHTRDRRDEAADILVKLFQSHPTFPKAGYAVYMAGWMKICGGKLDEAKKLLTYMRSHLGAGNSWVNALVSDIEAYEAGDYQRFGMMGPK